MRERTLSALLIIPVVVVAIAAGGVGIGILVLVLAALAGREAERLLPPAGRPVIRNGVVGGALVLVAAAALPAILGSKLLGEQPAALDLAARVGAIDGVALVGVVAVALAMIAFARRDPADGFAAWSSTVFGALYVGLLGAVAILDHPVDGPGVGRAASSGPSGAGSSSSWPGSGASTRAPTSSGARSGGARSCPGSPRRRRSRASSAGSSWPPLVVALVLGDQRQLAAGGPDPRAPPGRRGAVRRPRRIAPQARRGREGLRHAPAGARRDPRPRRLDPVRGARPGSLGRPRAWLSREGRARRSASPSSARAARSGRRRSTSSPPSRPTGRSSRSRRARRPRCSRSRSGASALAWPPSAPTFPSTCRRAAPRCAGPARSRRSPRLPTWTSWSSRPAGS